MAHFYLFIIAFSTASLFGNVCSLIENVGNDIVASSSGVDVVGSTFLLNHQVTSEGILFAFSAFFRTDNVVKLQIWRPTKSDQQSFGLVSELSTIPSVINGREDVYIASRLTEPCTHVYPGDRVGVYFEQVPGAISYVFEPSDHSVLAHTLTNTSNPHKVNQVVDFGALIFPYDFSVRAYVDTNLTAYGKGEKVQCRQDIRIPREFSAVTTTTVPPTGQSGAIGATGPRGRPGARGVAGPAGELGTQGYAGATGATGPQGATGADGIVGAAGATGAFGKRGSTGATGPRGEKGESGAQGPRGPPATLGPAILASLNAGHSVLTSKRLLIVLTVWLVCLTIILIILLIFFVLKLRRARRQAANSTNACVPTKQVFDWHLLRPSNDEIHPDSWMSTLKRESYHEFSVDVIRVDENEKPSESSMENENKNKLLTLHSVFSRSDDHLVTSSDSASQIMKF